MKKFLYNILLFVFPAYIILAVGDYFLSKRAGKSNFFHLESWYDLMHGSIDADIVIMGNSRALMQVDPNILDSIIGINSYNLGIDGSSINRQIRKYHLFRKYNKKPKLIIQNIDHLSMVYYVGYEMEQFYPYFWNKDMRKEFVATEPFSIWDKYLPLYRYYHNLKWQDLVGLITDTKHRMSKGYMENDIQWDFTKYRKEYSTQFNNHERTEKMFDEYLANAKAEGIKIVFMYSPVYIGLTKNLLNPQEMHDKYQEFANKYNIPILDYTYMSICYDTKYFYNATHINKKGVEIFSDSLANDIKALGIL